MRWDRLFGFFGLVAILIYFGKNAEERRAASDAQHPARAALPEAPPKEKVDPKKLDYNLPVYTDDYAIVCPQTIFFEPRADRGPSAIYDTFLSIWDRSGKVKRLGCEELRGGIRVYARRMKEPYNDFIGLRFDEGAIPSYFTMEAHLKN